MYSPRFLGMCGRKSLSVASTVGDLTVICQLEECALVESTSKLVPPNELRDVRVTCFKVTDLRAKPGMYPERNMGL